jgi:hypothetical protein
MERVKTSYDSITSQKQEVEINYKQLQKENINLMNKNTSLVNKSNECQILTRKLLDDLKNRLIEKHESN